MKNAQLWIKSIKIDKICDIMWWASDCKQSLNILRLGKYLSKSFETLKTETTRHYTKELWKNWLSGPSMDITKWSITQQSLVIINWNFGIRRQNKVTHSSPKFWFLSWYFWSRSSTVKSLKEAWDWQSLIDKQKFAINCQLYIILDFKCIQFYLILTSIYWAIVHW